MSSFTMATNGQSATEGQILNLNVLSGNTVNVNFSGDRSSDPDGTVIAWEWRLNGIRVPNDTFTGSNMVLSLGAGTYVVTLLVIDNRNAQSQAAQGVVQILESSDTIIYDHQLGDNYDHFADPVDGDDLNIQKFNLTNPEYTPSGYLTSITLRMTVTQDAIDAGSGWRLKATTSAPFDTCFSDQFVSAQGRTAGVPFDFTFTFSGSCPQIFFNFSNGQRMYSWGRGEGPPFGYKLAYNPPDGHFWQIIRAKTGQ